ncbi:MAG: ABC transporter ATP-binding protein [Rhodobacteraceae bacterium]|nr:ABC transporter ATP-binding protein [Paracoccaceae bacterium]
MNAVIPKIEFAGVSKSYGTGSKQFQAIEPTSLAIEDRSFVTVVGPSGCGKTTLMLMAAGLVEPDTGSVKVSGKPVKGPSPDRGVVFQQFALFPWLTVQKNVEFGLKLAGVPAAESESRARQYIDLVGLTGFENNLPKTLSGGMKQRCAIARAWAVDPEILLMDEPFGALDALTRVALNNQLLDAWSQRKSTVMFITHDVDEAVYLATDIVVMAARPGRIAKRIRVDLPWPRTEEVRFSAEFAEYRNTVWHAVHGV